jgi:hypothetical protein
MANRGKNIEAHPWVAAATICEKLLEDKDGAISIIRMVDRFTVPRPPPDWNKKTPLVIALTGIVSFRSGDVNGERVVSIYGTSPSGKRREKLLEAKVLFQGESAGVNMKLNLVFRFFSEGNHWVDIYVEKWHATRIPITIMFESASPESAMT